MELLELRYVTQGVWGQIPLFCVYGLWTYAIGNSSVLERGYNEVEDLWFTFHASKIVIFI